MQLTLHTDSQVFDQLYDEWDALVQRSTNRLLFLSWAWQSTWWASYQAGALWIVTCRTDEGALIGIAPWFIETRTTDDGGAERVLRTIGCVDVTDYLDLIVDAHYHESIIAELAAFLAAHQDAYTRINLCNLQAESPTLARLSQSLGAVGYSVETVQQEVCPHIVLPASFEGYLESLDKKQRHELRRKIRRMDGETVQHLVVSDAADLDPHIDRFIDLMRASHPDKAVFLEDERHIAFFRAMLPAIARCGWLRLSFLLVEGVACAVYCHFDYDGQILVYNSGLDPQKNTHLSPGIVLLCYDIQWAIENGRTIFDFLRGNENYKYRMGAVDRVIFKLRASYEQP